MVSIRGHYKNKMVGFENFKDRKEIKEWILIEKKEDGLVEIITQGDFAHCRNAARLYNGDYDISLVPHEEFIRNAKPLH